MGGDGASVLVVGSGGREHAMAWKLSHSQLVAKVLVAPGNGGTAASGKGAAGASKIENVPKSELNVDDNEAVVRFCREKQIELVVVGPEVPLVNGIADALREANIPCFGPSKLAARLEGSKAFSKAFMIRHNIPTAEFRSFTDYEAAVKYVREVTTKHKVVVKASGLAAGKGVILPDTTEEAVDALKSIMVDKELGAEAGAEVVVEELMDGPEVSVFAFSDGERVHLLPPAQDHKRIFDGDKGPNTGGMGAYCPAPVLTKELETFVRKNIVERTVAGARAEGFPFVGLLYTGLMLTSAGPKVLEYNCRFGDPETQAVLMLLRSDLYKIMLACDEGNLVNAGPIECKQGYSAATVVAASKGYPGSYEKGKRITGIADADAFAGVKVFQAGTALTGTDDSTLVTSGGRVLAVSACSRSLEEALLLAYNGMRKINFEGMQYRQDIGHRAIGGRSAGALSSGTPSGAAPRELLARAKEALADPQNAVGLAVAVAGIAVLTAVLVARSLSTSSSSSA
ncbi:Trifunctional purine biosynthetic protein adenosine-3 [Hondaea fermentalgiana]|uniref:phosphoribosylamine--glycine ligase n=1 Tax=Hondaea fermentalgiana TaxID=2315210 RepID=A0A2R5GC90_9STRA|nr:Trifunctional purine biosynthetic protein adenosine-3 [Hondaea fermentalgiana]|eukprot:GBG28165.1 Trifunctional purine biosynthetic protein adenosine-3 [Hondaea fermentalgiana]